MKARRPQNNSHKSDFLLNLLKLASAHKLYSGLLGTIILSSAVALFAPGAEVRRTGENVSFALMGATGAMLTAEPLNGGLRANARKNKLLAESLTAKLSDKELASQQREITLQSRETHLKTIEATYKQRCDNSAAQKILRETEAQKRKFESQLEIDRRKIENAARADVRSAEAKLKVAVKLADEKEKKLVETIATHKKALAEAESFYQSQTDRVSLEKQVALDSARAEVAAARAEVEKARADANHVRSECGNYQAQLEAVKIEGERQVARVGKQMYEAVFKEHELGSVRTEATVSKLVGDLERAELERSVLKVENNSLKAPKLCGVYGPQGDMARRIQGAIHGLSIERSVEGRKFHENAGYRMHFHGIKELGTSDVFLFEQLSGTSDDFNRHKAAIAQHSLRGAKLESIEYNDASGCIEFSVAARKKEVVSASDLSRLIKSDSYYLSRSKVWSRTGFYAPSESGKTSSAEILGSQWAMENQGDRFFHFPNKESVKNYVTAKIASSGSDECAQAFADLAHLVDDIQAGRTKRLARKQHHVFDDSDTVISKALDGLITREEILDFFSRASHCGIGFTLIGHSTSANRQAGMTHSDFNNLTRIYSGSNIMTALQNTQVVSSARAESLKTQYENLRDLFEEKNEKLGLITEGDSADPGAFRFALVIESNKAPYFCELPALDLLSAAAEGLPSITPQTPLSSPQQPPQQPSAEGKLRGDAISHDTELPTVAGVAEGLEGKTPSARKCRKCGGSLESQGIVKSGANQGKRKFQCKSEKHTRAMGAKTTYFDD